MLFKDLKVGNSVYVFDSNNLDVKKGTVNAVSFPHMSIKQPTLGMVVDVTINLNGDVKLYEIKDSSEIAYAGNLMIISDVNNLLNELNQIKSNSEAIINSVDEHKLKIEKCNKLISLFDPIYKERELTNLRFDKIESAINQLAASNEKLTKILTELNK